MSKKEIKGEDGKVYSVKEKKPFYKKTWFIVIGLFLLAVMFIGGGDSGSEDVNVEEGQEVVEKEEEEKEQEEVIKITAYELVAEYDENKARANKDYKGKTLEVTGYVSRTSDSGGKPYFFLKGEEEFAVTDVEVKVVDEEEQYDKIYDMNEDEEVTVRGTLKGDGLFVVELRDAVFVE